MTTLPSVLNEASIGINDGKRTISTSSIPDVLTGALGAGAGGAMSFAALYALGVTGLSAAGVTSGLAAAGAIIGGGMVAGIFVLAAPAAVLAGLGVWVSSIFKAKRLLQLKQEYYVEAIKKQNTILNELKNKHNLSKERIDYLTSLNNLLVKAIKDLMSDMGDKTPAINHALELGA